MTLSYEEAREFLGEDDEIIDGQVIEMVVPSLEDFDEN